MIRLYDSLISGNAYKARLVLTQLRIPFTHILLDTLKGETRTPEFLTVNPYGQVPAVVLDDGEVLTQSGAILCYFAEGTPLLPADKLSRARVLQWMFFEQNSLEPYLGAAYFWLTLVKGGRELQVHALEDWIEKGYQAFNVMEKHLATNDFVAAGHYTIADIALYGYTHLAHECDFDLAAFPSIRAWLNRVVDQPSHVPMDWHPAAEAAE